MTDDAAAKSRGNPQRCMKGSEARPYVPRTNKNEITTTTWRGTRMRRRAVYDAATVRSHVVVQRCEDVQSHDGARSYGVQNHRDRPISKMLNRELAPRRAAYRVHRTGPPQSRLVVVTSPHSSLFFSSLLLLLFFSSPSLFALSLLVSLFALLSSPFSPLPSLLLFLLLCMAIATRGWRHRRFSPRGFSLRVRLTKLRRILSFVTSFVSSVFETRSSRLKGGIM